MLITLAALAIHRGYPIVCSIRSPCGLQGRGQRTLPLPCGWQVASGVIGDTPIVCVVLYARRVYRTLAAWAYDTLFRIGHPPRIGVSPVLAA